MGCSKCSSKRKVYSNIILSQEIRKISNKKSNLGFLGGTVVENLPANAGETGLSPGLGRSHMPWSN